MDSSATRPVGTVTFMLTDLEGSTRKWEENPAAMRQALEVHNQLVRDAVSRSRGAVVNERGEGDAVFATFQSAPDAISAAIAVQQALRRQRWPAPINAMDVRIALNTGEGDFRGGIYHGHPAINICARIRALAHGGQILISGTTAELVRHHLPPGAALKDLGEQRLRDIPRPMRVWQVLHPQLRSDFPPLQPAAAEQLPPKPVPARARLTSSSRAWLRWELVAPAIVAVATLVVNLALGLQPLLAALAALAVLGFGVATGFVLSNVGHAQAVSVAAAPEGRESPSDALTTPPRDRAYPLSKREREVARYVGLGGSNRGIATKLFVEERTVENHVQNCLNKLGLKNRTQLAVWARDHGLLDNDLSTDK